MPRNVSSIDLRALDDRADAGLASSTTPLERLLLVETLTREAWAVAGLSIPTYSRGETPVSIRPLRAPRSPGK